MSDLSLLLTGGFALLLLALSIVDARTGLLPDVLTLPGAGLALVTAPLRDLPLLEALFGAGIGGGLFWLAAQRPNTMGLGDAKFMLLLGALCGVCALPLILSVASATGLAIALCTGRRRVPFGPFLSLGATLHLLGVRV